ncbi:unnamed protein product, partial [Callosobruchus maculatus]
MKNNTRCLFIGVSRDVCNLCLCEHTRGARCPEGLCFNISFQYNKRTFGYVTYDDLELCTG